MSAIDIAVTRLKSEEGFRATKYVDTVGKITIGYGFNVDAGITQNAAAALLSAQVQDAATALSSYVWFPSDATRASVLLDLAINLGINGLLHFPMMLAAIGRQDWSGAHDALLDSAAAKLLPGRYTNLATLLLNGDP